MTAHQRKSYPKKVLPNILSSHIYFPKRLPSSLSFPSFTPVPLAMDASVGSSRSPPQRNGTTKPPTTESVTETTDRIRNQLRQLRLDDMASLAQQQQIETGNPIIDEQVSWINSSISNLFHLLEYLLYTWGSMATK